MSRAANAVLAVYTQFGLNHRGMVVDATGDREPDRSESTGSRRELRSSARQTPCLAPYQTPAPMSSEGISWIIPVIHERTLRFSSDDSWPPPRGECYSLPAARRRAGRLRAMASDQTLDPSDNRSRSRRDGSDVRSDRQALRTTPHLRPMTLTPLILILVSYMASR